jgi:hypothetical protein
VVIKALKEVRTEYNIILKPYTAKTREAEK